MNILHDNTDFGAQTLFLGFEGLCLPFFPLKIVFFADQCMASHDHNDF
jgi:hypothetical protein